LSDTADPSPPNRVRAGGAAASAGFRFQQELGALVELWMLTGTQPDQRLGLGNSRIDWVRFETEAPVDDVMFKTSSGGYVVVQAKTSVNLSQNLESPFGQAVAQFVSYWRACRDGDGQRGWDRTIVPHHDRLVLAVGPNVPAAIRVDLAEALRLRSQPGSAPLTQRQTRAIEEFEACATAAWQSQTSDQVDPRLLADLARTIIIFAYDPDGADAPAFDALARNVVGQGNGRDLHAALMTLSGRLMSQRGGIDVGQLRREVSSLGVRLAESPDYKADIAALQAHSQSIATSLTAYEAIEISGSRIEMPRECQESVNRALETGSFLIVGEPGAGKSAVLNALARDLRGRGADVIQLAVDRYSIESLDGLRRELKLDHALLDVLDSWDGPDPGWLVIDALDATRGGKGEDAYRTLIKEVIGRETRWHVVASIRTFDLRMGQQFRELFRGSPPEPQLAEPGFGSVRHVRIPAWSDAEFLGLLDRAPALRQALTGAPRPLLDLARVPFNTRLIADLIADGVLRDSLAQISSQAQLLALYWDHRVVRHGTAASACLGRAVTAMVDGQALRAPTLQVAQPDPQMVDTLCREGVLIKVEGDRWLQFRHHILFDYSAAKLLLDPALIVAGEQRFPKENAPGLMLAPALGFVLQEIWEAESDHARFWTAVAEIVSDQGGDPVIRSYAGRLSAEYPKLEHDVLVIAQRLALPNSKMAAALEHAAGALAVRLEDDREIPTAPWNALAGALVRHASRIANTLRFLLLLLTERVDPPLHTQQVGEAARALLQFALSTNAPGRLAVMTIPFVVDTYATDPAASRPLLLSIFNEDRLAAHAWEEVPAVCRKIGLVIAQDPDLAAIIYAKTYGHAVTGDQKTSMSGSQILPLTSNAAQDYGMAMFALSERYDHFLQTHPEEAIRALAGAVEGYVLRRHPPPESAPQIGLTIAGRSLLLYGDQSFAWGHDTEARYGRDADVLVAKYLQHLRKVDEAEAVALADWTAEYASFAILWARLLLAAAERGDGLVDYLWPIASTEPFLVLPDTRKDAVDVVAAGYLRRTPEERAAFEARALLFNFSRYSDPVGSRESFLRRLFATIGRDALVTEEARSWISEVDGAPAARNQRLMRVESSFRQLGPYDWIDDLDRSDPQAADFIATIEAAKQTLGLRQGDAPASFSLVAALSTLETLAEALADSTVPDGLRATAEETIAQGCNRILAAKLMERAAEDEPGEDATNRFIRLLRIPLGSEKPTSDAETERQFEEGPAWGSPAPRVDAALALLDLSLQRPDLYLSLVEEIDRVLNDPHPAVRLQAGSHLIRLWDVDRPGFWQRLGDRLDNENNLGVLEFLIGAVLGAVLHADPPHTEIYALRLLERFDGQRGQFRVEHELSDKLAVLWVTHAREDAHQQLENWIADPAVHHGALHRVISTLRDATISGLQIEPHTDHDLRHRAQALVMAIVEVASQRLPPLLVIKDASEAQIAEGRAYVELIDTACQELYFGSGAAGTDQTSADPAGMSVFLAEVAPILRRIGDHATPHTVYNLMQLLERLLPADPAVAFDLASHAILTGGKASGFQFESMGADLMVQLVGLCLADHKEIFELPARQAALINCLETFMEAGWPAARRLLYRLPELIQ
jgi:hypothetical protein